VKTLSQAGAPMQPLKTLSRRLLLEHSRFLTVEEHTVELPDGRVIHDWPWLVMPDYVNVLPVTAGGEALLFRQMKYGVEGVSLAPVGGYLEPGEDPLAGARRELLEETGCVSDEWMSIGRFRVDSNRGAGIANFFLARAVRKTAEPQSDDLEEQEVVMLSVKELEESLDRGEFKVLGWAACVALALRCLRP